VTLATLAVNPLEVWPAGMVTLPGTVMMALLLDKVTLAPPDGAGALNVTVQFADPGALTVPGEQLTVDGTTATVKLTAADCCCPLSVAVMLAFCAELRFPVVAETVVLVWPVKIVTLAGTESAAVLLARATDMELVAAALSETVQVLDALLPKVEGAQEIPVS